MIKKISQSLWFSMMHGIKNNNTITINNWILDLLNPIHKEIINEPSR